MRKPVYFDYASTTPVAPEVATKMAWCLTLEGNFANSASRSHSYGWQAEEAIENAREQVAKLIAADPREIVWTSGATEANNLALKGAAEIYRAQHPLLNAEAPGHIIVSAVEHKSVLDPIIWLENNGFAVTRLMPTPEGIITPEVLQAALRDDTFLVSIMQVNNELGCINDIKALSAICNNRNILFHCDAVQSVGKLEIDVKDLGIDLLSLSAHKFYGPKGIGALFVRRASDVKIAPQIHGGGQERNMRSGTLATHQCVGMGEAAALGAKNLRDECERISRLRDKLWQGIANLPNVKRNGSATQTVCGILNVAFASSAEEGCDGETLLLALRDLAISSGSACNSASMSPSYVLKAIGLTDAQAQASLRFSVGCYTTPAEIEFAIEHIREIVTKLRKA
ncbi:MAG: aminotransferase class V-fold PLP-dependent enzyme [Pseudomonadota bacterium]